MHSKCQGVCALRVQYRCRICVICEACRDAYELRQFDMRRFGGSDKLTAAAQQQQHVQQRSSGDTFAEWAHTALCSCSSSLLQAAADLKTPPSVQWVIALWRVGLSQHQASNYRRKVRFFAQTF